MDDGRMPYYYVDFFITTNAQLFLQQLHGYSLYILSLLHYAVLSSVKVRTYIRLSSNKAVGVERLHFYEGLLQFSYISNISHSCNFKNISFFCRFVQGVKTILFIPKIYFKNFPEPVCIKPKLCVSNVKKIS